MKTLKKLLFGGIVLGIIGYFLYQHIGEGEEIIRVLRKVSPLFLILALLMQIGFYYSWFTLFRNTFNIFGIDWSMKDIVKTFLRFSAVSIATPLGGTAGNGVYVQKAKEDSYSAIIAITGAYSATMIYYVVVSVMILISSIIMSINNTLVPYQTTAFYLMLSLIGLSGAALNFGGIFPNITRKVFTTIQDIRNYWNKIFKRKKPILEKWAYKKSEEWIEISKITREKFPKVMKLFKYAIFAFAFQFMTMGLIFAGVGHNVAIENLLPGVSLSLLFSVISPTPQGIGVVEVLLPQIFVSFGIGKATASVVTIVFRALTIWLPAIVGLLYVSRNQVRNVINKDKGIGA